MELLVNYFKGGCGDFTQEVLLTVSRQLRVHCAPSSSLQRQYVVVYRSVSLPWAIVITHLWRMPHVCGHLFTIILFNF